MKVESIDVNTLLLDLENSRYPETPDSQEDAIKKMVELQGDRIVSLAKDIVEHGLDPSERLIVLEEDGSHIVYEGNRRVTALKLLHDPDVIEENIVTLKIKKILQSKPNIPNTVDCVIYDDEQEFEHWVNLKHTGYNSGAGRVQWTGQEVDRHKAKHGNTSFGNQLLSFIHTDKSIPERISGNTKKLSITNINRLLGTKSVRKSLGVEPPVTGVLYCYEEKENFIRKILIILDCMLETDDKGKVLFTVDRIKKVGDRVEFVSQLGLFESEEKLAKPWKVCEPNSYVKQSVKGASEFGETKGPYSDPSPENTDEKDSSDKETGGQGSEGSGNDSTSKPHTKPNPNRNNLVPANVQLKISDKKCSGIFRELKTTLKHEDHPNSLAIMLRIFVELSLSCYIDNNSIQLEHNKTGLHDKVVKVTNHLLEMKKLTSKQCSAIQASSSNSLKSNGALQQYIHNNYMFPERTSVNGMWDNFEPLFIGIWS